MLHKIIAHFLGKNRVLKRKQGLNKSTLSHEIIGIHTCTHKIMHIPNHTKIHMLAQTCNHAFIGHTYIAEQKFLITHKKYLSKVFNLGNKSGGVTLPLVPSYV
jgi:hypothetical protein